MSKQNIEDIYPLSPMQQGMLFHRLYATRTDVYFHQAEFTLHGKLEVVAFEKAWERVVSRHPILRSAFIWERGQEPFQVVRQRVKLPLEHQDWRDLSPADQQAELAAFLKVDRERGIELFKAPLMRLTLIQLADDVSHLIWSHHHMLLDGWSVALVLKEIFTFYEALRRREDLHLERPRPYGDYIAWLLSQDLKKAEQFWSETLKGFSAPIKLGVEQASTDLHAHEHGYSDLSIGLTEQEAASLHGFAQQQKLTVNTLAQGAWAVLLARYSGEEDVVFGAATSGRPVELSGVESMIGNFINTLPVRVRVTPQDKTLDWLRQLQRQQVEARQFEYSPLVQIQKWSEIPPGESLFETIVVFENYPVDASLSESRGGLEISNPRVDDRTNYPLSLVISGGSRFSLRFIYDRGRYDTATIGRMLGHLKTILIGMIDQPAERLSYLPLLTVPERRQMLVDWNDTSTEYAKERCIHELFETQVEATPGAIAVVSEDEQLTYGELNERANQLAHLLKSTGVGRGSLVAVLMHRSSNMIPALLAILKAGGAYVPIEPAYPKSRIEWILSSHNIDCLITQSLLLETVAQLQLPALQHIVCLDEAGDEGAIVELGPQKKIWTRDELHLFAKENLPAQTSPEDFAYIIFTSGSTGTPKGVIVSHQPVINLIDWVNRTFDINSSDRVLFVTSLCFDLSVYDVFGLLAAGGSIRVVSEPDVRDPERLLHMLTTESITFWDSAPAALQQLVPFFPATRFPRGNKLRLVFMSGDWVPVTLPELLMRTFPSVEVIALGGATEATVWSNFYPISEVDPSWPSIPYGKPIQNSQYHIADAILNPCPIGVAGDLYIGGECLSTGYSDEPIFTAEKFIPNPFGQTPGDRLYKTGDRARYLASGDIEFLGRVDNQVKIRGFRIELGEIEAALSQHPGVRAAIVVAREDVPKEKHLVAYLVPDEERAQTISNLLRFEESGELAGHQQQELPNGMMVVYRNKNETEFMFKKIFEDESYLRHQIKLEPGACIFDVGANIGLFSLFVGQVCRSARIYAFEPLPPLFEALRINTQLHGLDVRLMQCGLGSETKVEEFTYYPNVTLISGRFADAAEERGIVKSFLLNQPEKHDTAQEPSGAQLDELLAERLQSETIACQVKTLSDVIRESNVERIDLLKINVEKSELDVLAGIEDADWQKIRQIVVEVHDIENRLEQISRMLESQGYSLIVEQEEWLKDTGLYNIFAVRPETRSTASRDDDVRLRARDQQKNVWTSPSRFISDARDFLKDKLPEYMMPSAFVLLHALPLTSNGKVDRRALPTPGKGRETLEGAFVPPRTSAEEVLADIWAEVLGVERVGVNDNFFELGGDSILSIQVNARANKAGLKLTTRQLFQHRTIAELAAAASTAEPVSAEQGAVSGSVPLTPIQRSFFAEQQVEPQHFNQSLLLELRQPVDVAILRRAFVKLVEQHDALRLRFTRTADGWEQFNAAAETHEFFTVVDLKHLAGAEQTAALEAHGTGLQASLDLSEGPLLRVCYYELGGEPQARLLLVIHHLAVDGVSWRILLEDVASGYEQAAAGKDEIRLVAKTTSYKEWAEQLWAYAQGDEVGEQGEYWGEVVRRARQVPRLPVDQAGGENTVAAARTVEVSLTREETAALLSEVPAVYRTEINEVLLTALVTALGRWTGQRQMLVEMEGHGREEIGEGVDVTRTVGWFTTLYPVVLEVGEAAGVGEALKVVKEQVRGVRGHGLGWGVLRWLREAEGSSGLAAEAELSFNYLGQFDQMFSASSPFSLAEESAGAERSLKARRRRLIEINAMVIGGQLRISWGYSSAIHHQATIENLAHNYVDALQRLIEHSGSTQGIEEFYPLSPVQEGMLFHNLYAPQAGDYILQSHSLLEKQPDVVAFEQAWQHVVDRHTVLRTFFVWEGVKRPIQVVQRQVKLPLEQQDWSGLEKLEQQKQLKTFLLEDRARGFDLNRAPLMRLVLIRLDEHSYYFIWTHHHLLLDGWSLPLIFREVFETYEALRQGRELELPRPRPFRDYIAWLQQQDLKQAEVFWRQMMRGLKSVPRLQIARSGNNSVAQQEGYKEHRVALPAATTTALRALGRQHQLTLNTLVQGALSLLLSHYTGSQEVVFGMTVSGRPPQLADIESMVGVFINVLPMRVRIRPDEALLVWLQGIQEQQMEMRQYEYTPLTRISRWSEVPGGQPLFETLLSFENYPVNDTLPQIGDRLSIQQHRIESKDNYPLSIGVVPDQQLHLWLTYDSQFDQEAIRGFSELFQTLLNCFVTQPHADVKMLEEILTREGNKQQARQRHEREENSLQRFKKVKPKPVSLSSDNLVALDTLTPDGVLPLVFRPQVDDLDLADWARSHGELIETNLSKHGALLFRGVKLKTAGDFEEVAAAICPDLFGEYGDLPREGLGGKVYSSTPFPADQAILFHNESAHLHRWPLKIWLFCMKAPEQGGETPIVDCREVYKMLDPHLRDRFARKGLLYVRNYIEGLDVSWQSFFQTTDKAAVEAYCRQASIDLEWTGNNNLRTRRRAPAVVRHPKTAEFSFFNQIQLHHISFLASDVRSSLTSLFREEDLPRNVYYGDGSALEESVLSEILQIYKAASVSFPWQPGDILMLDNMLIAHGRNPYSGERKIVVTMGEMVSSEELRVGSK
jgi:amino acid adenylation domain-containing protein/non-ribosomal peptide synthase protein (TIGR01720 family)/FkbM family methyltransferase